MNKKDFLKKTRDVLRANYDTYAKAAHDIGISSTHLSNVLGGKVSVPQALLNYMGYKEIETHNYIKEEK